jgi:aminoglycoside phosphotransferase (APT) family kinase protein
VAKRTLIRWSELGMPQRADGLYDVAEIKAWRARGMGQGEGATEGEDDETGGEHYWKRVQAKEQALLSRIKRERLEGLLLPKSEVDKREARLMAIAKAALMAFPRGLPPLLEGRDMHQMEAIIDEQVRGVLARMVSAPGKAR